MLKQLKLFEDEPEPVNEEARIATAEFKARFEMYLDETRNRIIFKILVWGPGTRSQSAVANKRRQILQHLREAKHQCWFSEEFKLPPEESLKAYELAQARNVDLIILLVEPHALGPLGEMHDFCSHEELLPKMRIFFPKAMENSSYSGLGLVRTIQKGGYCKLTMYKEIDIEACHVLTEAMEWVHARRTYRYCHSSV